MTRGTCVQPLTFYRLREGHLCSPHLSSWTRVLCLSFSEVTFPHTPSSTCVSLSSFPAACAHAASPPANTHGILGTLSSPVKPLQRSDFLFGFRPFSSSTGLPKGSVSPQSRSSFPRCPGFQRLLVRRTDPQRSAKAVGARPIYPVFHGSVCVSGQ